MRRILLILLLCSPLLLSAQKKYYHSVFWGRIVVGDKITDKLKWDVYLQMRTQNIPSEANFFAAPQFFSVWTWLNYNITDRFKLSFSPFGYFISYPLLTKPEDVNLPGIREFRWAARLEQEQKFKWFNYSNRYSIEYRRRDLQNNNVYQPNWRLRYMFKLEKPFKGLLSRERPVSFFISNEIFVQFGKAVKGNPNIFDQNRISAGTTYEVLRNIKLTLSYLYVIQERNSGQEFDGANTFWTIIAFENLFSQFKAKNKSTKHPVF